MTRERKVRWTEENGALMVRVLKSDRLFTIPKPSEETSDFFVSYGLKQWIADRFASLTESVSIEQSIEESIEKITSGVLKAERKTSSIRSRIEGKLSDLSDADREMAVTVLRKLGLL